MDRRQLIPSRPAPPPPDHVVYYSRPGAVQIGPEKTYNVVCVGGRMGGKSAFIEYLCDRSFTPGPYVSTATVVHRTLQDFPVGDENCRVEFTEVGSSCPEYPVTAETCMENADVILFFFSVADERAFRGLYRLIEQAIFAKQEHAVLAMVGSQTGDQVQVDQKKAETMALEFDEAIPVKMVSAAMGFNVEATLREAVMACQERRPANTSGEDEDDQGCLPGACLDSAIEYYDRARDWTRDRCNLQ